ncbi:hypothetical protein Q5X79_14540 [Acinetobacter baumannii]|nr:hypothetical protein [Acinetobacter baumannii]
MPNYIENENNLKTIFDYKNLQTIANLVLETKIISFYLISKNLDDIKITSRYYNILINGKILIKTKDMRSNFYSFQKIDNILFSYFRLLTNYRYKHYFNDILEDLNRNIEISGLIYGGLIPDLEMRITNYFIKLLLLNPGEKTSISIYTWNQSLQETSIANNDKIINLLINLKKLIIFFNDYNSLGWDYKKLEISKNRLTSYISNLITHTEKYLKFKFESIELDQNKIEDLISQNTLHIKDLKDTLQETFFHSFFKKVNYKQNIASSSYYETYDSKYLTTEYSIHLDSIFKTNYYAHIIEELFFKKIQKIKRTEYLFTKNVFQTLQNIYLKSCIFSLPIVIYNNDEILNFFLHNCNKNLFPTYNIKKLKNNIDYKVGKTIFKYEGKLPKNSFYILPNNIFKNIFLSKISSDFLSKVKISIDTNNHQKALVKVEFPCEVHLTENSLVLEVITREYTK